MDNIINLEYPHFNLNNKIYFNIFNKSVNDVFKSLSPPRLHKNNLCEVKNIDIETNKKFTINGPDLIHFNTIKINKKYDLNEIQNIIIKTKDFEINLPFKILLNFSQIKYADPSPNFYKKKDDFHLIKINDFIFSSDQGKFIFPMRDFNIIITSEKQIDITLISNIIIIDKNYTNLLNKQFYFNINNFKKYDIHNAKYYKIENELKIHSIFMIFDKSFDNVDICINGMNNNFIFETPPQQVHSGYMHHIDLIDNFDVKNIQFNFDTCLSGSIYLLSSNKIDVSECQTENIKKFEIIEEVIMQVPRNHIIDFIEHDEHDENVKIKFNDDGSICLYKSIEKEIVNENNNDLESITQSKFDLINVECLNSYSICEESKNVPDGIYDSVIYNTTTNKLNTIDKKYIGFLPRLIKISKMFSLNDIQNFKIQKTDDKNYFKFEISFDILIKISKKHYDNDYYYIELSKDLFVNHDFYIMNLTSMPLLFIINSIHDIPYELVMDTIESNIPIRYFDNRGMDHALSPNLDDIINIKNFVNIFTKKEIKDNICLFHGSCPVSGIFIDTNSEIQRVKLTYLDPYMNILTIIFDYDNITLESFCQVIEKNVWLNLYYDIFRDILPCEITNHIESFYENTYCVFISFDTINNTWIA